MTEVLAGDSAVASAVLHFIQAPGRTKAVFWGHLGNTPIIAYIFPVLVQQADNYLPKCF